MGTSAVFVSIYNNVYLCARVHVSNNWVVTSSNETKESFSLLTNQLCNFVSIFEDNDDRGGMGGSKDRQPLVHDLITFFYIVVEISHTYVRTYVNTYLCTYVCISRRLYRIRRERNSQLTENTYTYLSIVYRSTRVERQATNELALLALWMG